MSDLKKWENRGAGFAGRDGDFASAEASGFASSPSDAGAAVAPLPFSGSNSSSSRRPSMRTRYVGSTFALKSKLSTFSSLPCHG